MPTIHRRYESVRSLDHTVEHHHVDFLASEGIAAFAIEAAAIEGLKDQKSLSLPAPGQWGDLVHASAGKTKVELRWLAIGVERGWTHAGSGRTAAKGKA